jgi:hypothetical protein
VQPPVFLRVGVRFVARVDDGPRPGGRGRDTFPDVLGPLRDAEQGTPCGLEDLAGPREYLTSDEERDHDLGEAAELAVTRDEVVLVAPVRVPGRIGVVLEEVDLSRDALLTEARLRRFQ